MSELVEATGEAAEGLADALMTADARTEEALRSSSGFGLAVGAFIVGAGLGGALGYILRKRQLETKYNEISANEIAEMRQHYNKKAVALENTVDKPKLEDIVREQGYASEPPMAVTPPSSVVEAAKESTEEGVEETPIATEVISEDEPEVRNVFRDAEVVDEWDYHTELARRSPLKPYIIHVDEREEQHAYENTTLTYYESDDVVCNESDEVMSEAERERLIGEANLTKFGHGSGDNSIVYIRNDQLEIDFEVVRSPNSYAEEVHGFEPEPEIRHADRRRGRQSFDDE